MKLVPNVVVLPVITKLDTDAERVMTAALAEPLEGCVVIGVKDGELYFASSWADGGDVLWWMAKAKKALLDL